MAKVASGTYSASSNAAVSCSSSGGSSMMNGDQFRVSKQGTYTIRTIPRYYIIFYYHNHGLDS
jgi:hypothetical protein